MYFFCSLCLLLSGDVNILDIADFFLTVSCQWYEKTGDHRCQMHPVIHFVYCGVFKCRCKDASAWTSAVNQIHWGIWSADKNVNASKYVPKMHRSAQITKVTFHGKPVVWLSLSVWRFSSHKQYVNRCSFETIYLSVATLPVSMPDGQRFHRVQTDLYKAKLSSSCSLK